MNIPSTYIEWVELINYIKSHPRNDMYIETLNKGKLDYDEVLIVRLKNELCDCIFSRIGKELESFTRYLKMEVDYNSFSLKVLELRKELIYGNKLASINILPPKIKEEIQKQIKDNADQIQELLVEQTSRIDKSGAINSIIRNNPINRF